MNESGVFFLFALFFAVIRIAIALHREANPLPPVPKLRPWAEPRSNESLDGYYRRMDGTDHAMDDAEFNERRYREPLGMPRLGAAWDLDHLAEKEGHGDH
jgi:hypothetical protein